MPGSDDVELDVVGDLGEAAAPSRPAAPPTLLDSMPADSVAAVSVTEYGAHLGEAIDTLDARGIPGQVPPHQLKATLKKAGIDLDKIAGSLEDVAVFARADSTSDPRRRAGV